jgi:hypothetical protein
MIKGSIAIPNVDPKSWRSRGRKRKPQPAIASAIVTPAPMKKRRGSVIRLGEVASEAPAPPIRSAIVEPMRTPTNAMLAHLAEDITDEERNRRADLADAMMRRIKRRIAASKRD